MNFLHHYHLKYTPLSPLHIGTDESYEPGNYVIDEVAGALYSFDSQAALGALSDSDRQQLLGIVNARPDDSMITNVQAFFHRHREKLLAVATPPLPTAQGVKSLYEKRIGKTAQHEGSGKRVINKLEIDRTFYNPANGQPLLPGSSIKGAIRTALLDEINAGKSLLHEGERNNKLQQRLFGGGNFHTDPMRLLAVGDANWQARLDQPACRIQFAVNRKRKPVMKDGKLTKPLADNLYQLLECIIPQHYQSFAGTLTLHDTHAIAQPNPKLPRPDLHWPIETIARACNRFYIHLLQQELHGLKERNYLNQDWLKQIEELLNSGLLKRLNDGQAFLLRVGRHSGAEALTLDGVRNIKIMQGQGQKPTYKKTPLTWWLAADNSNDQQSLLPFGWLLVEINPQQPDSLLQSVMNQNQAQLEPWYQQQLARQNTLKQQLQQQQFKREQQRQAEAQAAEALRREQAAEAERLAGLSPVEQEIAQFLKAIPALEHDSKLLQELEKGRWQNEDAKQVAAYIKTLMQEAGRWQADYTGDSKQKVKLRDRSLKVQKYLN